MEAPEFRGQQKVGAWTVNQVAERTTIAPQNRPEVIGVRRKAADVAGKDVIFREDPVEFDLGREPVFELRPAACGIEPTDECVRVGGITSIHDRLSDRCTQAANGPAPVELAREGHESQDRNLPVRHARPCVNVMVPWPILAAVVTRCAYAQRMAKHRPRPRAAKSVSGLTGTFTSRR